MALTNCRVVLVRPKFPGNLGATARVMRNFGLTDLVLVAPEADPCDRQARQMSAHGEEILDRSCTVDDFGSAVADCLLVVATSARTGGPYRRQSAGLPEEILPRVAEGMTAGPAALVFGPEDSGLSNDEVAHCHFLIHVPTDAAYPALNLAQAVAICAYELRRAWLSPLSPEYGGEGLGVRGPASREATGPLTPNPSPPYSGERGEQRGKQTAPPAPFAVQERMFESLRNALEDIHFLYGQSADSLMHAVRHLIGRAGPTAMEVDVLFGLARQLRWAAGQMRDKPQA